MQAWKSLQKDLDSRRYKANPFEQKYVDLTTSSYAAENPLESEGLDLDYLSKSIRARSDIITCQIAYLLKEATSVSNTFDDVAAKNNQQRTSASTNDDASTDGNYFVDAGHPIHHQQSDIVDQYDGDQRSLLGDDLLWIQDLIRMLGPTKMEDIATEFIRADSTHMRPIKDLHHTLSPRIDMAPTTYRSTESFLSSK